MGEPTDFHGKGFRISSLPKWCDDLGWMAKSRPGLTLVLHDRIFGHLLGDFDSWWCFVSFVSLFSIFFFHHSKCSWTFCECTLLFWNAHPVSMSFQKRSSFYYTTTHRHPPFPGKVLGSWRCLQGIGAIVAPSWGGAPVDGEFRSSNPNRLTVRVHGILDHLFEIMMILIFNTCGFLQDQLYEMFHRKEIMRYFLSYELVLDGFHPSTIGWRVFVVDSAERLATLPWSFGFWHKRWMTICLMELLLGRYSQQKGETPSFIYPTWFRFSCIKSQGRNFQAFWPIFWRKKCFFCPPSKLTWLGGYTSPLLIGNTYSIVFFCPLSC